MDGEERADTRHCQLVQDAKMVGPSVLSFTACVANCIECVDNVGTMECTECQAGYALKASDKSCKSKYADALLSVSDT